MTALKTIFPTRERIPGARHHALSRIDVETPVRPGDDILVFHCLSGARTSGNAGRLAAAVQDCQAYILEGGLDSWKKAGLPVTLDRRQPIELMQQVQIMAGMLVLIGVVFGTVLAPICYAVSAFVGAGLLLAGVTDFSGMARLIAVMPWNRRAAAEQ